MANLLSERQESIQYLTFNKVNKFNAFDPALLQELQIQLEQANQDPKVRLIVLKANGPHFSAGADLTWMQAMATYTEEDNLADAKILAKLMYTLNQSHKPTIAAVQGAAFGGGAGLVAACDIAIAADNAKFCFSEVKLGLIPAVISPYVIQTIGPKAATWLFMSAETISAQRAYELNLVQHCVPSADLDEFIQNYVETMTKWAPQAIYDSKALVRRIHGKPITDELTNTTAALIAKKRVSAEGQIGLNAFLNKEKPNWITESE